MRLLGFRHIGLLGFGAALGWGILGVGLGQDAAIAQSIVPDGTLGPERSVSGTPGVVRGVPVNLITGGTARGLNLFHSFLSFDVVKGNPTYFDSQGATNILTRVTGLNRSTIDDTLGVVGNANLFFVNPRGIVFGPNAKLDISGSFFASTADRINFPNGVFSAVNPERPLLTLNVNPGLQTGVTYGGSIINQGKIGVFDPNSRVIGVGNAIDLRAKQIDLQAGSEVGADQDVRLEASDTIQMNGTQNARTFVRSEKANLLLISPKIEMTGYAFVNTVTSPGSSNQGGSIGIRTQDLRLSGGAEILAQTQGSGKSGDILIIPNDPTQPSNITIDGYTKFTKFNGPRDPDGGFSSGLFVSTENSLAPNALPATGNGGNLFVEGFTNLNLSNGAVISGRSRSSGSGGNVFLNVKNLNITGGAQITVAAYDSGSAGNMVINAENIAISGSDSTWKGRFDAVEKASNLEQAKLTIDPFGPASGLQASTLKGGSTQSNQSGVIILHGSSSISMADNAEISSSTFGKSNAGFISISTGKSYATVQTLFNSVLAAANSSNFDDFLGVGGGGSVTLDDSRIFSTVEGGAVGNAGLINISTGQLNLKNVGQIQTIVRGSSKSSSGGKGNAGFILVKATESVKGSGFMDKVEEDGSTSRFGSGLLSSVEEGAISPSSACAVSNPPCGSILVKTPLLYLNDGAYLNTRNLSPEGRGGDIRVESNFVVLDRSSFFLTVSKSGNGGNIGLQSRYLVGISRGSFITTQGGSPENDTSGNGGNIAIGQDFVIIEPEYKVIRNSDSPTLLIYGFPYKNNDIIARAFRGTNYNPGQGNGGEVQISTLTLRNLAKRKDTLISDDIDATSNVFGLDGIVNANSYNIDPDRGLQPLPDKYRDYRLSEGCDPRTRREDNAFRQTGSGQIATDPSDRLELKVATRSTVGETPKPENTQAITPELIPAIGWTRGPDGTIQMIAAQHSGVTLPKVPALCPT
jgi:filamentous hemagglutinin family protein